MFSFYSHYNELKVIETSIKNESRSIVYAESYIETQINSLFDIMYKNGYINQDNRATLTGLNASYIHELPCLVFCDTYNNFGKFNNHSEAEIVSFLSCFYDLKLKDDFIINYPNSLKDELRYTQDRINYYIDKECQTELCITSKFNLQYNLIDYVSEWYNNVSSIEETKFFFDKISRELDIFTGDFIKCCMKIINMCNELIILCENDCNYPLLEKINNIQSNLQKSIVSNRSLYL
jgi:superfamily II RNA helicase